MIRIFGLLSAFFLFLLLGSPIVLMSSNAWADCCGFTCKLGCTCRGTFPCAYDPGDSNTVTAENALPDTGSPQIGIARDTLPSTATRPDLTENLLELTTAGKCFRDKVALSLLGNVREALKFIPTHFDERNLVAFLIDADKEK